MAGKFAGLGIAVEEAQRMTIIHPVTMQPLRRVIADGDGKTMETDETAWIDLLALTSPVGRAHDRTVTDRRLKMTTQTYNAEMLDADTTEKLARLTRGWFLVDLEGNPLDVPFSQSNARELYSMPTLSWLRDQVSGFVVNLGNFLPAASAS